MTQDSFLFFKNVRQYYYHFTDLPQAHWQAFRWDDRYVGNDRPMLNPVIVTDWDKMEAYLLVEPNGFLDNEDTLTIQEKTRDGKVYEYTLKERGRENMLEFATKIYEGIMAENTFAIRVNESFVPLFTDEDDFENFRVVMGDYYRLTHVF